MIPQDRLTAFFADRVWNNALRNLGLFEAIEWMAYPGDDGGLSPLERVKAGDGSAVIDEQMGLWPALRKEAEAFRKLGIA